MSIWLLIPLLFIIAIIQATLVPLIPIAGLKLDLALLVVVAQGLLAPAGEAAQWGFILGLFLDLTSGLPFGIHTLTLTCIGLLMGVGQVYLFHGNILAPPAATILATLVDNVVILGILTILSWPINWNEYLIHITLPTAILNTVTLPLAYFPLQWLHRRIRPRLEI